jgi:hypothetical protein
MTVEQARQLKDHNYVYDSSRHYHLRIHHANKHDLWFWHCKKRSKDLIVRAGGIVTRVYLGSRNIKPSNTEFLAQLQAE